MDIPVSDKFQPAPGVEYEETPVETPEAKPETTPEPTEQPAEPKAEEPKEELKEEPKEPESRPNRKATPIANLLSKKHELESQLEQERAEKAELLRKVDELSKRPESSQSNDKIKQLAEAYNVDENFLSELVEATRETVKPELPEEVAKLLQERELQKQTEAEYQAFNKRLDSLSKTLNDESLNDSKVRQKLMELAYSTEKAPDGEPYHEKELAELYFGFIKPEIEPGKTSAESSRGGTQKTEIIDFEEISKRDDPKDIEKMDDDTFKKYNQWLNERSSRTPLRRL